VKHPYRTGWAGLRKKGGKRQRRVKKDTPKRRARTRERGVFSITKTRRKIKSFRGKKGFKGSLGRIQKKKKVTNEELRVKGNPSKGKRRS